MNIIELFCTVNAKCFILVSHIVIVPLGIAGAVSAHNNKKTLVQDFYNIRRVFNTVLCHHNSCSINISSQATM